MRKLLLFLFVLSSLFAQSQGTIRDKLQTNYAIGIDFRNVGARERMVIPLDTLATDSGSIAYKNLQFWFRNNLRWVPAGNGTKIDDSTFVIGCCDTIKLKTNLTDIHVLLVAGQSNAQGFNTDGSNKITTLPGSVLQWYQGVIKPGDDPVGNANVSSAWPAWGRKYYSLTGRKVCFVPSAFSGTSQTVAANTGQGTWDTTGVLFDTSVARMNAAIIALRAAGYNPIIDGVLWSQGENDAIAINGSLTTQADYLAALRKMITNYRKIFGKQLAFYIHQTATQTSASDVGYAQIRAAQVLAVNSDSLINIVFTNALDYPARGKFSDVYHYSQPGYNEMGEVSAANVVSANYGWQPQAGNIYTRFSNVGIGIGLPTFPLHVVGSSATANAGSFTGRTGFNRASPLYGVDVGDSLRVGNMIASRRGFGSAPSISTTSFLTLLNTNNLVINQSTGVDYPELRFAGPLGTDVPYSGVINGINFVNAGTIKQPLLLTTSYYFGSPAGPIILRPGTDGTNRRVDRAYQNTGDSIKLETNGNGETYIDGKSTHVGATKILTAASATAADSVAMIASDGTVHKKNLADFTAGGGGSGTKSVVPRYRVAIGILGDTIGSSSVLRYVDSVKQLSAAYINAFNSLTAGSTLYNAKPTKFDVLFGNSITAKTIAQKYLAYSSRLCNMSNTLEINYGIGGTRMVSLTPGDSAMLERTFLIPTYNSSVHNNLYFGYGTNDWRTGSVDSATFRSTYNTVIDAAIAKGWPLDHIILVSAGYSITANTSLQHRNKEFVDITLHLGKLKGVKVVDVYTTMITNGGILGLQTDSVHLNEFGNELWALAISDTLGLKVGDVRAGAYMYARQINIKQYLNHPALSIEDSNGVAYAEVRGWHGAGSFDASMSIGLDAMDSLTTGTNDYAYGQEALRGITTGSGNNGYGFNTINKNKTGNYNSAFGHNSLSKITGTRNTAVGAFSLQNATAVNDLTAIGYAALQNNTSGINNTAVGASALNANLTGNNNVAIGSNALVSGTTISNNTAAGASAMFNNLTGNTNAAFGYLSLFTFTSGVGNSAFGPNTLRLLQGASSLNSAFGSGALEIATTSSRNTAVGASGMKQVTSGGNNTGIGYAHGDSITTGLENFFGGYQSAFNLQGAASRNIFLGSNSGLNWRLGNDNIVIGQYLVPANTNWSKKVIISQDGDTAALVIDSNLNVGIGVLNPTAKLDIDGNLRIRSVTTGTQATDSGLVISGGVVKAVKAQVATDGVFTPTLTNTTNVSASAAYPGQWSRNGNTVTMSGEVDIDPTAGATLTVLTMTIPVASTLGNSYNLSGTASNDDVIGNTARVKSNGAGAAVISFIPNLLTSGRYSYIYQYTIN